MQRSEREELTKTYSGEDNDGADEDPRTGAEEAEEPSSSSIQAED
jgi:hypothetical protein